MEKYVVSIYNCFKVYGDTVVGVNLYRQYLFAIDVDKFNIFIKYKDDLSNFEQLFPDFFSLLLKLGVIECVDESNKFKYLLYENRIRVFSSSEYRLTINPTLNCNFSCWYCYESHNNKIMKNSTMKSILLYIEKILASNRISTFYLDWFGGEPLLCYKNVMQKVALEAKSICESNNIYFESGITTNGYLINRNMIDFFKSINMQSFQITIDGDKDNHNKTRYCKDGKGSYDVIISNIIMLARELHPNNLAIRINYTSDVFNDILKISDDIPSDVRNKVTILLQQVWQDKEKCRVPFSSIEKVKYEFRKLGFLIDKEIFNLKGYTCYADLYNQAVINYDGRVFKCTARNFEREKEDGLLCNDGTIKWNNNVASKLSFATFENEKCLKCKYLPVCYGPCSQKISLVSSKSDFKKYCFEAGIVSTIDVILYEFYKTGNSLSHIFNYRD